MSPLHTVNGRILIKDGKLALSDDCCCGDNFCCFCTSSWSYEYNVGGGLCGVGCGDNKPWAGTSYGLGQGHTCTCYYQNNITGKQSSGRCDWIQFDPFPFNSTLIAKVCSASYSCRAADAAENGDPPLFNPVNQGADNNYAGSSPWTEIGRYSSCAKNRLSKEQCEKCTDPDPMTFDALFNDYCGIYHANQTNKRCKIQQVEWDGICIEDIPNN